MNDVNTDPTLLYIIESFWHNDTVNLNQDETIIYIFVHEAIHELGIPFMLMWSILIHLVDIEDKYLKGIHNRQCAKKWSSKYLGNMLRVTVQL